MGIQSPITSNRLHSNLLTIQKMKFMIFSLLAWPSAKSTPLPNSLEASDFQVVAVLALAMVLLDLVEFLPTDWPPAALKMADSALPTDSVPPVPLLSASSLTETEEANLSENKSLIFVWSKCS